MCLGKLGVQVLPTSKSVVIQKGPFLEHTLRLFPQLKVLYCKLLVSIVALVNHSAPLDCHHMLWITSMDVQ